NATAYYSDYRDFQIQLNRSVTDPQTGQPIPFSFVGNMPKARVKGGESTLAFWPTAHLAMSLGLAIIEGRDIKTIPGAPVTTQSQLVNAPRNTVTLGAQYSTTLRKLGQVTGRADYIHKSRIQYDYSNSPLIAQDPYGLLNARITWQPRESRLSFF